VKPFGCKLALQAFAVAGLTVGDGGTRVSVNSGVKLGVKLGSFGGAGVRVEVGSGRKVTTAVSGKVGPKSAVVCASGARVGSSATTAGVAVM
jgi:hypothetical protein